MSARNGVKWMAVVLCGVTLGVGVVMGQGEGGGTHEDPMALLDHGWSAYRVTQYSEAIHLFEQAETAFSAVSDGAGKVASLMGLGNCYAALSDFERAIGLLGQALTLASELGMADALGVLHRDLGRTYRRAGEWQQAETHYASAIEAVESACGNISEELLWRSSLPGTRSIYEEYLELLLDVGKPDGTLLVVERMRARASGAHLADGACGSPGSACESIGGEVVDAAAIESALCEVIADLPADTVVLQFATTEQATYVWTITRGRVSDPIRVEVPRDDLLSRVVDFRQAVEILPAGWNEAIALLDVLRQARYLYDLLLEPVAAEIEGYSQLVIIPSGPLYYLPFASLYDCPGCEPRAMLYGDLGEHLVERFALSYLPSLVTLRYVQGRRLAALGEPSLFALGDPDTGWPDHVPLPGAREEVLAIARLLAPPLEPVVYVGDAATECTVYAEAVSARYVHLSTFGVFNLVNPMFSYLQLAACETEDGKLYAFEVLSRLHLRADLVTLSASETLLPSLRDAERQVRVVRGADADDTAPLPSELLERITAGDELVGLTRAFIYAGTPTVLSTLWSVYDESTRELMVEFYTNLLEGGMNKAQALQAAQLHLLNYTVGSGMAIYRHPVHWAAFTLYGDWR